MYCLASGSSPQKASVRLPTISPSLGISAAQQHNTAQHNTAQHDTAQHSTAQHSIAHDSTAQHNTTQYSTAQPGFLKKHPLSPPLLLTHSMKCKSVSVLLKPRFVEKLLAPKQDSLCMICACELFWLIHILSCSVTCDRLYGKKTARPRKHLKEAFYLNPSRYRAEARKTHERAFYSNASCYRAHARNTSGQWHSAATFCYKAKAERSCPELYCILLVRLWCI